MTNSPEAILGILLGRICIDKECRVYSRYRWRPATAIVAGIRSAKGVGSVALIVQAVTFCVGAGCGPCLCMVQGPKEEGGAASHVGLNSND